MIKFINWFIRPLGYVCVEKECIAQYNSLLDEARDIMCALQDEKNMLRCIVYRNQQCNKPEYKDNVVPFDKHV
jgi:hypothetical protein